MSAPEHTLLVVDDNAENRDVLSRRLEKRGFKILQADSGQRALDLIEVQAVDLVLLDWMMPGLSGLDVLKRLRQRPATAQLPVIMATAKSESDDIVEALELGADDYVTKPLDFPVVLARVQAALRARRPAPAVSAAPGPGSPQEVGPGTLLAGRYQIETSLGSGSFGTVYRARHLDLERPVAVKVLQSRIGTDRSTLARFRREGVATCRVRHENAVAVLDFGVTDTEVAFLVMELLEGRSLEDEIFEAGVFSPRATAEILAPVCGALAEAHREGIIHRDIKPANIFLHQMPQGRVPKVLDFGIAKLIGTAAQKLTLDGWILGTPVYMAPERFRSEGYDSLSDVYSVGVVAYQMLAGCLPFEAPQDDPMAVAAMHAKKAPEPLRRHDPDIPAALEQLVMSALAKLPKHRPTAERFGGRLGELLAAGELSGEAMGIFSLGQEAPTLGPAGPTDAGTEPSGGKDPEG